MVPPSTTIWRWPTGVAHNVILFLENVGAVAHISSATLRDRACNRHSEERSFLGAKMKANRAGLTACLAMLTTACGGGDSDSSSPESNTEYMMRGEFPSMARCLEAIQQKAGQALKPVTDRPDQVSGNLSDGRFFICERKDSGTKGTYYEGTFTGVSKD